MMVCMLTNIKIAYKDAKSYAKCLATHNETEHRVYQDLISRESVTSKNKIVTFHKAMKEEKLKDDTKEISLCP
jgi:DNA-binding transcriptional regulator YhcF (GntR family)